MVVFVYVSVIEVEVDVDMCECRLPFDPVHEMEYSFVEHKFVVLDPVAVHDLEQKRVEENFGFEADSGFAQNENFELSYVVNLQLQMVLG